MYLLRSFISVVKLESSKSVWTDRSWFLRKFLHLPNEPFLRSNRTQMPKPIASTVIRRTYPFHSEPSLGMKVRSWIFALYCPVKFISQFSSQIDSINSVLLRHNMPILFHDILQCIPIYLKISDSIFDFWLINWCMNYGESDKTMFICQLFNGLKLNSSWN